MPGPPVHRVRPPRVSTVQVLHAFGEPALGNKDNEMEMVGHQAIRQDDPLPASGHLGEDSEELAAIVVRPVEGLPVISAAAQVVDPTRFDLARTASHDAKVT